MKDLEKIANEIRLLMIQALRPKESHHIGCSFSIVDIVTFLYFNQLKIDPKKPNANDRDIFILSKGHGALAVYAVLYKKDFFSKEFFLSYDQDGGMLPEHIHHQVPGVEVSTGSLGHGLPIGIGFATSFLNDKKKNRVFILMSDGELNEGSNWEALMSAGFHKLSNLTAIIDRNGLQGYSTTKKVLDLDPIEDKIKPFGWNVFKADGHDFDSLDQAFKDINQLKNKAPNLIIAKTIKGKGIPYFEGKFESHYKSINEELKQKLLKSLKVNS